MRINSSTTATVDFSGATLAGVLAGDAVSIDGAAYTATFADKNVGTDKPVTVYGVALSGADADNYTVSQPEGLTADITRKGITGSFTHNFTTVSGHLLSLRPARRRRPRT